MSISQIRSTGAAVELNFGGGFEKTLYAELQEKNDKKREEEMRQKLQDKIDVRIPLTDPELVDDPAAITDPNREDFFHDKGDLVARTNVIDSVVWDGERYSITQHVGQNVPRT